MLHHFMVYLSQDPRERGCLFPHSWTVALVNHGALPDLPMCPSLGLVQGLNGMAAA